MYILINDHAGHPFQVELSRSLAARGHEVVHTFIRDVLPILALSRFRQGQALADEVIAWLRVRGFRLSGFYNLGYDGRGKAVQGDFLFTSTSVSRAEAQRR